jgi:hypothetical protein
MCQASYGEVSQGNLESSTEGESRRRYTSGDPADKW